MAQATHGQMNNLTTLIKRLEAATSRLEDLTTVNTGTNIAGPAAEQNVPPPAAPPLAEPLPPSVEDYDELINADVAKYVKLSAELGGLIAEQSKSVERCFHEQRRFLVITTKAKKPDNSSQLFVDLLAGMQVQMTKVSNIRENNRHSDWINHLSTVSEGAPGLAWVTYDGKPAAFVEEMINAAKFFGNKVLKEYKGKDQRHIDWVNSYYQLLTVLQAYVKKHHLMGVAWNARGIDARDALNQVSEASLGAPSMTAGGAPPPPPPPPPPGPPPILGLDDPIAPEADSPDLGGVFAEINRGSQVTAGLRKVDKSQMTHKNPELRTSSVVRTPSGGSLRGKSPAPPSKTKPPHLTRKRPPKMTLEGNKWIIENYENEDKHIVVSDTELNHSVFIFRCKSSTIEIKGKVNAITINECVKTNVIADSLVSGIDVIKSNTFATQVLERIPTIQIDQCDGGTIYIPKESLDVEIFTSKTTAINVYIPDVGDDGDFAERAVPEQLKHTIKNGQLRSEIVEHAG